MLIVSKVSKSFGIQTVLGDVSFIINRGERVGLVGPNGCGKTTLLRIIAGAERADGGQISHESSVRLGYLPQGVESPPGRTLIEEALAAVPGWADARAALEAASHRMGEVGGSALDSVMAAYQSALERFESAGGYGLEDEALAILARLGLGDVDPATPVANLSGGQQTRLGLAGLLLSRPDLLLLDEPTNHLDIAGLEWLESFLADYPGAALIVSHDRTFLDHVVNGILELDGRTHTVTAYTGTYTDYAEAKARAIQRQWSAWKDQQAEIRRIERDIARTKEQSLQVERSTTPREPGVRRYAKKVARKALSREKRLERYLDAEERVEKPAGSWQMKLDFGEMERAGQEVARLEGLGHTYDGDRWLFREASLTLRHGERIAVLGPNGTGKTTLLEIIAGQIAPAEGRVKIGASARPGWMPQDHEDLPPESTPLEVILSARPISESEARSFLHFFLFAGDEALTPVGSLSYGQRARLLLARLVAGGANFLVLDEPVNHLDIPSRERFEAALEAFPGAVLFSAHDRAFIDRLATGVWALEDERIRAYLDREEMSRRKYSIGSAGDNGSD